MASTARCERASVEIFDIGRYRFYPDQFPSQLKVGQAQYAWLRHHGEFFGSCALEILAASRLKIRGKSLHVSM